MDSSSDEDILDGFKKTNNKKRTTKGAGAKKPAAKKPITVFCLSDDSDEDAPTNSNKKANAGSSADLSFEEQQIGLKNYDSILKSGSLAKKNDISSSSSSSSSSSMQAMDIIDYDTDDGPPEVDSKKLSSAEELLLKMQTSKSKIQSKGNAIDIEVDDKVNKRLNAFLLQTTKVQTAEERRKAQSILLSNSTAAANNIISIDESELLGPTINIITRLNGKHEQMWTIPASDTFDKFKKKLTHVYDLSASKDFCTIKLIFDGQTVKDSDTPSSLDLDDDGGEAPDLIDVKIDAKFYDKAVLYASRASISSRSSSSSSSSSAVAAVPQMKFVTRLNGAHERKWRISLTESFGKFKVKFASVYGIDDHLRIKLNFDGNIIRDTDTPQSLDMDDEDGEGDLIDVKIDAHLYDGAIKFVNAK